MAVSLLVCQFCGLQFELGRVRRPHEPKEAAWTPSGEGYMGGDDWSCIGTLCEWIPRTEEESKELEFPGFNGREHLAGADCTHTYGFSGARILPEEMKDFCHLQCLIPKTRNWQQSPDDKDYEIDSDHFLSGIGYAPDNECADEFEYLPSSGQRHGLDPFLIDNHLAEWEHRDGSPDTMQGDRKDCVPFHPECFNIFTRISMLRFGRVNLNGLKRWRDTFRDFDAFHKTWPTDKSARDSYGDYWSPEAGDEYLAANPLHVVGLKQAIDVISEDRGAKMLEKGRNPGTNEPLEEGHNYKLDTLCSRNLDELIPHHVREKLRDSSMPREFDQLMRSSPELNNLDRSGWRQLIIEDLPWLWEVEDLRFPVTNYQKLFRKAKYTLGIAFKGLYNRKRIWQDLEMICDKIASLE